MEKDEGHFRKWYAGQKTASRIMSFKSETYRMMIASPGDMPEERAAVTEAINEWNAQHAAAERIVLLPVKWETHSTPHHGRS